MILMLLSNEACRRSNVDVDKLQFGIRSLTVAVLIGRSQVRASARTPDKVGIAFRPRLAQTVAVLTGRSQRACVRGG
jgi:hypothetical protein